MAVGTKVRGIGGGLRLAVYDTSMALGIPGPRISGRQLLSCRRIVQAATLAVVLASRNCLAVQRALADTTDFVESDDLEPGGSCENGCVRQVVDAVARASGQVDCELRVQNLLDHTRDDAVGGALNVVHSCTDADGNLRYQVSEKGQQWKAPLVDWTPA